MRILIIEDDDLKADALEAHFRSEFLDATVECAKCMRDGILALERVAPDLVILDMNLPTYDGRSGEPRASVDARGGREVLRQLSRRTAALKVVVVTQYNLFGTEGSSITRAEMSTQLASRYPKHYLGTVHFRWSDEQWKEQLAHLLRSAGIDKCER